MSKCIRCGGSFLTRFKIKLKDAYICGKCAKELGLEKDFYKKSVAYSYDDIKDGWDAYLNRNRIKPSPSVPFRMAHYGEERDVMATDGELEIYNKLIEILPHRDEYRLVRVSDQYVTLKYGVYDIARFKWSEKAKWIVVPIDGTKKNYIESPDDVEQYLEPMLRQIANAEKYGING